MKAKNSKAGLLVAAALVSFGSVATAQEGQSARFVPLERLHPQDRAMLAERLREIESVVKIDWNTVIAGVDEEGHLVLKDRKFLDIGVVANPSCWAESKAK
jgi:hypothetical protein